jgi:DUF4097 and DUF4098 domain-containing protein YvlB
MTAETRRATIDHAIGPTGRFTVKVATADVSLGPSPDDHVRVRTSDGRTLPDDFEIATGDGTVSIRQVGRFLGISVGGDRSIGLEVEVPATAEVIVQTASGAVAVTGLTGDQQYRTASGDIRLEQAAGRIATESVSGDVAIGVDGTVELIVKTVAGDVGIDGDRIERVRLTTTSGDIRLTSSLGAGPHAIETLSGDALIATNSGIRVQARTISGDLRSDLPHTSDGMMGRRSLTVGDGTVELSFRSVSGDLRVADPARVHGREARSVVPTAQSPAATEEDDRRLEILRALERGEIDIAAAGERLALLDESADA